MPVLFTGIGFLKELIWFNQQKNSTIPGLLISSKLPVAKLEQFRLMYKLEKRHCIPFIATIIGVLFTNLITGIMTGGAVTIFDLT
jgi:MFS superfamily sulfate permease-like transporter